MRRRVGFLLGLLVLVLAAPVELQSFAKNLIEIQKPGCLQIVGCCPVEIRVRLLPEADRASFRAWLNGRDITARFAFANGILKALVTETDGLRVYSATQPKLILKGLNLLTVKASQGKRYTDADSHIFYARRTQAANHPPVANAGPDQTALVLGQITLDGSASSDLDGDSLSFAWSFVSRPAGSAAAISDPTALRPTFEVDKAGSYVIELVVNDGHQDSAPDTVTITTINSAPVANAGPDRTAHVLDSVTLDGSASSDVDGDPLTYWWELAEQPADSLAELVNPASVQPSFVVDEPGRYQVQLIVADGHQDSAPDTVTITTINSAPRANAGPDQTAHFLGPVTLDGSASSDVDGDDLTFKWSLTVKPVGSKAGLSGDTTPNPTFDADLPGEYVAQLVVNDGHLDSAPDTVTITFSNSKPVAHAGEDQEVVAGTLVLLDGSGSSDADGDELSYQWALVNSPGGSSAILDDNRTVSPSFTPDVAGTYVVQLIVSDGFLASDPDSARVTVTVRPPPVIESFTAAPTSISVGGSAALSWIISGALSASIDHGVGSVAPGSGSQTVSPAATTTYTLTAVNASGSVSAQATVTVVPVTRPVIASFVAAPGSIEPGQMAALSWSITGADSASIDHELGSVNPVSGSSSVMPSGTTRYTLTATNAAGSSSAQATVKVNTGLPPDPQEVAPALATGVVTTIQSATEFLYSGTDPIQTGIVPGTIDFKRVAVVRGKVMSRDGSPLSGVAITILDHPEYGQTLSRADGMFDLAVNGGGVLTVNYGMVGYLPAQRQVNVPWQGYVQCPNAALVPLDDAVNVLWFPAQEVQLARGTVMSDEDGTRRLTMLIPYETNAELVFADGHRLSVETLSVRFTEYTVGPNGPLAMPAELPPTSDYTYAVELTADEVAAAGADHVQFDRPVFLYLENFVDIPVGMHVPVGFYDLKKSAWIPSTDGRVIGIADIYAPNLALLDVDGDGDADGEDDDLATALGISFEERVVLAGLYTKGQTLWRVPITHFSDPDLNYGAAPTGDATTPNEFLPVNSDGKSKNNSSVSGYGALDIENQVLRESIQITGTPFSLNYASDRVVGRGEAYDVDIPLSGDVLPQGVKEIKLEIWLAGRQFTYSFEATTNQSYQFQWDGKDAFGRELQGAHKASIRIGYVYDAVYQEPPELEQTFALLSGIPISTSAARSEWTLWQEHEVTFNLPPTWFAVGQGVGGWTLSAHHAYDVNGGVLHLGDGRNRTWQSGTSPERIIVPVAGNGEEGYQGDDVPALETSLKEPCGVAVAPNGSLFISDMRNNRIRLVDKDGVIHTVAGPGDGSGIGDDGPPTAALLQMPWGIALLGEKELYIAEYQGNRIRRVEGLNGQESIITTVAGDGTGGYSGDGGPATEAQLSGPINIAVAPDGTLYIADFFNNRIRRVGTDGIITTLAGTGEEGFDGDGGPATQAKLDWPGGVAVGPDGAVYIADTYNLRVRRVGTDGIINTIAGTGDRATYGDGGPAVEAALSYPYNVVATPDGTLYIADTDGKRIRKVDTQGIITTIAGTGERGDTGDGGPATAAMLDIPYGLAVAPDGTVYVTSANRVRKVLPANPVSPTQEFLIPSEDGGVVYRFNAEGRHLSTLNALTGATLLTFSYDAANRLGGVVDAYGKTTTIERDAYGSPQALVGPYGQRTLLQVNADGYLTSITNPASEAIQLGYGAGGLLTSVTDPKTNSYQFPYNPAGLLDGASDPAGGSSAFTQNTSGRLSEVTHTTAEGRTSIHSVEELALGGQRRLITRTDGTQMEMVEGVLDGQKREGVTTVTLPTGTTVTEIRGPDPRFGMQHPIVQNRTVTVPYRGGELRSTLEVERAAELMDPNNPLWLQSLTEIVTYNGRSFTQSYDGDTKVFSTMTPEGRWSTRQLDDNGRLIAAFTPGFGQTNYTYNAQGRLTDVTRTCGDGTRLKRLSYDADGYLQAVTDPLNQTVNFQRDAVGRVTLLTRPDEQQVAFVYDSNGNMIQISPPEKPPHHFSFTTIDLPDTYTPPTVDSSSAATAYSYNKDRQRTEIARPDEQTVALEYDSAGRLAGIQVAPGGERITYGYHETTGQLKKVEGPDDVAQSFTYHGGLLASNAYSGPVDGNLTRSYDQDFRLTQLEVRGAPFPISFQYDNDSLLTGVGYDQTNGMLTLVRGSESGLITATNFGSAQKVADRRGYNGFGELTSYTADCNGSACLAIQYLRDDLGRITQKVETVAGSTKIYRYGYDPVGRLIEVRDGGDVVISSYGYDANGNRLSYSGPLGDAAGTYDDQDRLVSYGGNSYTYTANGELLTKVAGGQTTSHVYDALGNLRSVTLPNGTVVSYLVDGGNRRMAKRINGARVKGFLYGGGFSPLAELDADNHVVSLFLYGTRGHVPDLMLKNDGTGTFIPYRIITDHLGSPRLVINALNGTEIAQQLDYDEFGRVLTDTSPGFQPFGFAGGLYDPDTGLVRFGFRDYDPETGRWTTNDPAGFVAGSSNLYAYSGNNPLNRIDPSGLKPTGTGGDGWWERKRKEAWALYRWFTESGAPAPYTEEELNQLSLAGENNPLNVSIELDVKQTESELETSQNFLNFARGTIYFDVSKFQSAIATSGGPYANDFLGYFDQNYHSTVITKDRMELLISDYAEDMAPQDPARQEEIRKSLQFSY